MEEKIREIGESLYNMAEHNRITNFQQWNEKMFELLDKAFPDRERVGDLAVEVDSYIHERHSFGFCDLCGCYINYESDKWFDLGMTEKHEDFWLERSLPMWEKFYADTTNDNAIEDVCDMCFADLTTEQGFRKLILTDYSGITTRGGKSHEDETMGEFLDEVGIKADADEFEISYALLTCGFHPLKDSHYPFLTDWEKMRDFVKLSKEEFLESYSYLTETEYDMTKKIWENYYE